MEYMKKVGRYFIKYFMGEGQPMKKSIEVSKYGVRRPSESGKKFEPYQEQTIQFQNRCQFSKSNKRSSCFEKVLSSQKSVGLMEFSFMVLMDTSSILFYVPAPTRGQISMVDLLKIGADFV